VKEISIVKIPTPTIKDNGRVRMGYATPPFPPAQPPNLIDDHKVRIGFATPAFPPARAR